MEIILVHNRDLKKGNIYIKPNEYKTPTHNLSDSEKLEKLTEFLQEQYTQASEFIEEVENVDDNDVDLDRDDVISSDAVINITGQALEIINPNI